MAHDHIVNDTDRHFVIDPITRAITNQSEKILLIQGDHNSERFTFEIPRTVEEHDMSLCNRVEIHFCNIKADRTATNADVYIADDVAIEGENLIFSWLISRNATLYDGTLSFVVKFKCVADNGSIEYVWKTAVFKGISIGESYDNAGALVEEYSDILAEWDARITALEQGGAGIVVDDHWDIKSTNPIQQKLIGEALQGITGEYYSKFQTINKSLAEIPEWAKQPEKPIYTIDDIPGAVSQADFEDVRGDVNWIAENMVDKSEIPIVDQTFSHTSTNAQSGVAVAQALKAAGGDCVPKNLSSFPQYSSVDLKANGLDNFLIYLFKSNSKDKLTTSLDTLKSVIVGDIDTALDNIIAIQEGLIGGAEE